MAFQFLRSAPSSNTHSRTPSPNARTMPDFPRSDAFESNLRPSTPSYWPSRENRDLVDTYIHSRDNSMERRGTIEKDSFMKSRTFRSDTDASFLTLNPTSAEEPKVAIAQGIRGNWTKLVPHVIAVVVTTSIIQLSFRNVYLMDLLAPSHEISRGLTQGGALSLLQIAAKLHEMLILASLSSLVLHALQSRLTGRGGLPLGMISNAFELSSAAFLNRRSFWNSLWAVDKVTGKRFSVASFWFLSLFSAVLVMLSGPSSAIAIIPTLNYFEVHTPFTEQLPPYYIFNHTAELWPSHLVTANLIGPGGPNKNVSCSIVTNTLNQERCPTGGFRDLYNWVAGLLYQDTDKGTNISFAADRGDTRRILTAQSCNSSFSGRASGVTINAFVDGAMVSYWKYVQTNLKGKILEAAQPHISLASDTDIFAPRTEILCNSYLNSGYNRSNPEAQPTMFFPTLDGNNSIFPVPDWAYKYPRAINATNSTLVEIPSAGPYTPSLGAVITIPLVLNQNGTWIQSSENLACSIYSQWIPVDVWYEPTINDQVSHTITTDLGDTCLTSGRDTSSGRQPINMTISKGYADAINQPITFVVGNISAITGMLGRFVYPTNDKVPNGVIFKGPQPNGNSSTTPYEVLQRMRAKLISIILAGAVTDGLARIAGNGEFPYTAPMFLLPNRTTEGELQGKFTMTSSLAGVDMPLNTTNPEEEKKWLRLNPTFQRYGYGYRWAGNITTQLGISVLIVHIIIAVSHTMYILISVIGYGQGIGRAWESMPEILALAINSRPSERLNNTCAGINETRTWNETIAVREVSEGHLEMVAGRREIQMAASPRPRVKYGTLPNSGAVRRRWLE